MKFDFQKDMAALKAGDRSVFNLLMEDYYYWSVKQARTVIFDLERAKDAALTFWEQLPTKLKQYDDGDSSFVAWMQACVVNCARDFARQQQPNLRYYSDTERIYSVNEDKNTPLAQLIAYENMNAIEKALRSAQQKKVFWLLMREVSPKEIAEECDLSLSRTRNIISEIRKIITAQCSDSE